MTIKEKRIACAKDVIRQIKTRRYKPTEGDYGTLPARLAKKIDSLDHDDNKGLQDSLQGFSGKCEACANGCMYLSQIRLYDNVEPAEFTYVFKQLSRMSMITGLKKLFGNNFHLQEAAFEGIRSYGMGYGISETVLAKAMAFYRKYRSPEKRLVAMCRNIIKHGTFKP